MLQTKRWGKPQRQKESDWRNDQLTSLMVKLGRNQSKEAPSLFSCSSISYPHLQNDPWHAKMIYPSFLKLLQCCPCLWNLKNTRKDKTCFRPQWTVHFHVTCWCTPHVHHRNSGLFVNETHGRACNDRVLQCLLLHLLLISFRFLAFKTLLKGG